MVNEMAHCLVTGAAGFLGRNLVKALLARGARVRALVRDTPLRLAHDRVECLMGDVTDQSRMEAACEGIDTVFHAAAVIALLGGRSCASPKSHPPRSSSLSPLVAVMETTDTRQRSHPGGRR